MEVEGRGRRDELYIIGRPIEKLSTMADAKKSMSKLIWMHPTRGEKDKRLQGFTR